jgi:hypothetical protein
MPPQLSTATSELSAGPDPLMICCDTKATVRTICKIHEAKNGSGFAVEKTAMHIFQKDSG